MITTFARVWRAEGPRAVGARLLDRWAEERRRRSFVPASEPPPGFSCPLLNVAAAAPAPRLGGVQAQLLWRLEAEAALRPVALLYPDRGSAGGFRLEVQSGELRRALRWNGEVGPPPSGVAGHPSPPVAEPMGALLTDAAWEQAVTWAAARCGARRLVVEGLAGMPLVSLLRLRRQGFGLILALHDFAAFCPRPHLLERLAPPAAPRFCHYSRDAERCARCLDRDFPGLAPGFQEERRAVARELIASADAVIHPSRFLAAAHRDLFGGAGDAAATRVISPASSDAGADADAAAGPTHRRWRAERSEPLRVAWVGAVQAHKGALVLEAAKRRMQGTGIRWTAYGGGDATILRRWRRLAGLRVRGYYRAGALPALLRRDRIDVALALSVVPESYGLTLDECAAAAVPVVAFDLGAQGERLRAAEGSAGFLMDGPLADDAEAAGQALADLLGKVLAGQLVLPALGSGPVQPQSAAATARAWAEVYAALALFR